MVTGGMGSVLGRLVLISVPLPIGMGAPVEPGAFGSVTSGIGRRVTAGSLDSAPVDAGAVGFVPLNGGGIVRSSSSSPSTSVVAGSVDAGAVGSVVLNSGGIRRPSSSPSSVAVGAGSDEAGSVGFVPFDGAGIRRSSSLSSDCVEDAAGADSVDADVVGAVPFTSGIRLSTALETRDSTGSMMGSRIPVPEAEPSVTLGISDCSDLGAVGLFEGETGVTSMSLDDAASVDDGSSDVSVLAGAVGFVVDAEVVLTVSLDVSLAVEDASEDVSVSSDCDVTTPVGSRTMPVGEVVVVSSLVLFCGKLVGSSVVEASVVEASVVSVAKSSSSALEVDVGIASEELVAGSVSVRLIRMVEESERVRMSSRSVKLSEGVSERLGSLRGSVVERSVSGNEVSGASERSSLLDSVLTPSEDESEVSGAWARSSLLNSVLISSESGGEVSGASEMTGSLLSSVLIPSESGSEVSEAASVSVGKSSS